MDFKLVLQKLLSAFEEQNIRYGLMGGFALGLYGAGRSTIDIDFLVNRDDLPKVDRLMKDHGYECQYQTENVSQYISSLKVFGEVDFLHAFRPIALEMLKRVQEKEIFGGALKIKILKPEDIIGLKLQAVSNNPSRQSQDIADIELLVSLHKNNLDRTVLKRYFDLFAMNDLYKRLFKE